MTSIQTNKPSENCSINLSIYINNLENFNFFKNNSYNQPS
jgi:hypothetical protein